MSDLRECPFCGAPGVIRPRYDEKMMENYAWAGECTKCEVALDTHDTEAEAIAAWNRRAPSAEETRLRAEVASLRATLGQQPAAEGAEPIGCPLPGACGAVRAHAAAFRAGAAEMRERAAETAEKAVWCPCGGPPCQTPAGHGCGVSPAEGVEVAAAIRALPLPAGGSGWRPIETAPIDQEIDVWVARSEDGHAYSHGYRQERVVWNATDQYWEGERTAILPRQVTHWQPLPAAPEEGG